MVFVLFGDDRLSWRDCHVRLSLSGSGATKRTAGVGGSPVADVCFVSRRDGIPVVVCCILFGRSSLGIHVSLLGVPGVVVTSSGSVVDVDVPSPVVVDIWWRSVLARGSRNR